VCHISFAELWLGAEGLVWRISPQGRGSRRQAVRASGKRLPDVFISYRRSDRDVADRVAERLDNLGVEVWYDRALRPMTQWRADIDENLRSASVVLALWSPAALESRWVRSEASFADEHHVLLSAVVGPCEVPSPFQLGAPVDLTSWKDENDEPFWRLVEALAERLRQVELREYAILRQYRLSVEGASAPQPAFFDHQEMMRQCDELRDVVREHDPDVMVSLDPRAGLWAEMLFDWLQRRIPVVVGYRGAKPLPGYFAVDGGYLPSSIEELPRGVRVLLVNDRASPDFSLERSVRSALCDDRGFVHEGFLAVALTSSSQPKIDRVHVGSVAEGARVEIFYDAPEGNKRRGKS
jgi:hypothetical protein